MRAVLHIATLTALWTRVGSASPLMMGGMGDMMTGMGGLGGGGSGDSYSGGSAGGCPALQLVFARGTTEMQGTFGVVGKPLCTGLQAQVPNTACYDVVYSSNAEYMMTVAAGGQTADGFIRSLKGRCPSTKVVLGGYSKGAMVCHKVSASSGNVVGAVTFGDPNKNQPMPSTSAWKTWCARGDPVCLAGWEVMAHLSYGQNIAEAVRYLVNAYQSSGGGASAAAGPAASAAYGAQGAALAPPGGTAYGAQGAALAPPGGAGSSGASGLFGGGLAKMMGRRSNMDDHRSLTVSSSSSRHVDALTAIKRRSPTFMGTSWLHGLGGMGGMGGLGGLGGMGGGGGGGGGGDAFSSFMGGAMNGVGSSPLAGMMGGGGDSSASGSMGGSTPDTTGGMGGGAGTSSGMGGVSPSSQGAGASYGAQGTGLTPATQGTSGLTPATQGAGTPYGSSGTGLAPASGAASGTPDMTGATAGSGLSTVPGATGSTGGMQGTGLTPGSSGAGTYAGGAGGAGASNLLGGGDLSKMMGARRSVRKREEPDSATVEGTPERRSPLAMPMNWMQGLGGMGGGGSDPFASTPMGRGFQTPDVTKFLSMFPNGAGSPLLSGMGGGGGGLGSGMGGLSNLMGGGGLSKLMGGGMMGRKRELPQVIEPRDSTKSHQDGLNKHHRSRKHRKSTSCDQ